MIVFRENGPIDLDHQRRSLSLGNDRVSSSGISHDHNGNNSNSIANNSSSVNDVFYSMRVVVQSKSFIHQEVSEGANFVVVVN